MNQQLYNSLMKTISHTLKQTLNESEKPLLTLGEHKAEMKIDVLISKLINKSIDDISNQLIVEPFNSKIKSISRYCKLFINDDTTSIYALFFSMDKVTSKVNNLLLYVISGSALQTPKQITLLSGQETAKLLKKFNDSATQEFKNFMYTHGIQQFNWNSFISKIETMPVVSAATKQAAKKLYNELIKAKKNIKYFIDFANIVNPKGDLEYEGALLTDIIPILQQLDKQQ